MRSGSHTAHVAFPADYTNNEGRVVTKTGAAEATLSALATDVPWGVIESVDGDGLGGEIVLPGGITRVRVGVAGVAPGADDLLQVDAASGVVAFAGGPASYVVGRLMPSEAAALAADSMPEILVMADFRA